MPSNARQYFLGLLVFTLASLCVRAQTKVDLLEFELTQAKERQHQLEQQLTAGGGAPSGLDETRKEVDLLLERNNRMSVRESTAYYRIYAGTPESAFSYLQQAEEVYQNYQKLFPDYRFSGKDPAHFIIYPSRELYLKYEKVDPAIAGHALSRRVQYRNSDGSQTGTLLRLAFYDVPATDPNSRTFRHELTHLFTYDLLNQNSSQEIQPNRFLNEGTSEYFAVMNAPEQQQMRIEPLRNSPSPTPMQWFGLIGYPPGPAIRNYYSEAYLFVRWLAEQSSAGDRLKALLKLQSPDQAQQLIESPAQQQFASRLNLQDYQTWRARVLQR